MLIFNPKCVIRGVYVMTLGGLGCRRIVWMRPRPRRIAKPFNRSYVNIDARAELRSAPLRFVNSKPFEAGKHGYVSHRQVNLLVM
jgi:hypothetical protein